MSKRFFFLIAVILMQGGCSQLPDRTIADHYRLIAQDVVEDTSICYDLPDGACITRIPGRVTAVWVSPLYITARRTSISRDGDEVVGYYIIFRQRDGEYVDPSMSVRGPLNFEDYKKLSVNLELPLLLDV